MNEHRISRPFASRLLGRVIRQERGAILVEELVTVAVIGLGLSILVAMIATGAIGVRTVDNQVKAEFLARSQLELIKNAPFETDPALYPSPAPLAGFTVTRNINTLDPGLQEITVTVSEDSTQLISLTGYKVDR
jgi:hypothetical protein